MRFPWSRRPEPAPSGQDADPPRRWLSTDDMPAGAGARALKALAGVAAARMPVAATPGAAQDANNGLGAKAVWGTIEGGLPDVLLGWFASQGFLGHQLAAIIAQHWLVDKACSLPARDAVRHGFNMTLEGVHSKEDDAEVQALHKANKRMALNRHMQEFIRKGRIFGIRIAIFRVDSTDPKYYEYPFNIDAVTPGSYQGITQVDPYWCTPVLDQAAASDPASSDFYNPTWWTINGKLYHRSHLCIFRTSDVPDVLRPAYLYGGVPVPQRIMERVYAAERTANEAPQLAMTKRTTVLTTDLEALLVNQTAATEHLTAFTQFRDNYAVKINNIGDTMEQFDTTLTGLDDIIMSQYQIVAAASGVPATKLLGTTPKGFSATGEYDESSYHEELETVQENDLTPLVERHLALLLRSEIEPRFVYPVGALNATLDWNPVDSPTAKEYAEINKLNAETDASLVSSGAIDGMDVRSRLRNDRNSGYTDLPEIDPDDALTDALGAADPLEAALAEADPLAPA